MTPPINVNSLIKTVNNGVTELVDIIFNGILEDIHMMKFSGKINMNNLLEWNSIHKNEKLYNLYFSPYNGEILKKVTQKLLYNGYICTLTKTGTSINYSVKIIDTFYIGKVVLYTSLPFLLMVFSYFISSSVNVQKVFNYNDLYI